MSDRKQNSYHNYIKLVEYYVRKMKDEVPDLNLSFVLQAVSFKFIEAASTAETDSQILDCLLAQAYLEGASRLLTNDESIKKEDMPKWKVDLGL